MDAKTAMFNFFQAEFKRERDSGFARLWRIPDTFALRFLDYFSVLTEAEQAALTGMFAYRALFRFFPAPTLIHSYPDGAAFQRYLNKRLLLPDTWKYLGTRALRSYLSGPNADLMPDDIARKAKAIQPVRAPEIRMAVKAIFAQSFGATAQNQGGGNWLYAGSYQGIDLVVEMHFNNWLAQLRYWVSVRDRQRGIKVTRFSYEALMGFSGEAHWDNLEQSNLAASIDLLRDLVIYCAELPQRLPPEYTVHCP